MTYRAAMCGEISSKICSLERLPLCVVVGCIKVLHGIGPIVIHDIWAEPEWSLVFPGRGRALLFSESSSQDETRLDFILGCLHGPKFMKTFISFFSLNMRVRQTASNANKIMQRRKINSKS